MNRRRVVLTTLIVFLLSLAIRPLFQTLPVPWGTLFWKICWVVFCLAGLMLLHRLGPGGAMRELGLSSPSNSAVAIALISSAPMLAIFALTSSPNRGATAGSILMTAAVAPLSEELLFRGYALLQLHRRAGWSFPTAILATSAVFGIAHRGVLTGRAGAWEIAGEMGVIALGGVFYGWLLVRWDNLWPAILLHASMNLYCELFACDQSVGQWSTNAGRALTVVLAIALTRLKAARAHSP